MSEHAVAIIQARMGSTRLPGKVLLPLPVVGGKPVLFHVLDRIAKVEGLDRIVVATTNRPEDEVFGNDIGALVWYPELPCPPFSRCSVGCYRHDGDESDLLSRYIFCAQNYGADIVLVVDSDCPLIDPETPTRMLLKMRESESTDYVGIRPRSIEGGVACVRLRALKLLRDKRTHGVFEGKERVYMEHATLAFEERPEEFTCEYIEPDPAYADLSKAHPFWLNTPADYAFLNRAFTFTGGGSSPTLKDVLDWLEREPWWKELNSEEKR